MSKTPRTDKKEFKLCDESISRPCSVVRSSFARQLEVELADKDRLIKKMQRAFKEILRVKRTVDLNLFDVEQIHAIANVALAAKASSRKQTCCNQTE